MKVKNLDRDTTIQYIELLKKRIDFNNLLNNFVRKYMKEHNLDGYGKFNGYHDSPTIEMKEALLNIHLNDALCDMSWMSEELKKEYAQSCAEIFGQVYSPAVNRYVLSDLHSLEKHLEELEVASQTRNEHNEMFKVERDLATNRMNIYFDGIPSFEIRNILKKNGFKWSSYLNAWTRQLTQNAEKSLLKLKSELL